MAATMALFHKPTLKLTFSAPSKRDTSKPTWLFPFAASRSVFFGGFSFKIAVSKTRTKLVKTSAIRSGDGEKNVSIFQQEAFVKGSTGFRSEFMAKDFEATLNRLTKWLVVAFFVAVLLWKYDAESLWVAMGSVINVIVCFKLKRIFNQQRPVSTLKSDPRIFNQQRPVSTLKSDPGMPSSHAQSIFYIFVMSILLVLGRFGVNEYTLIISALALACGTYLSWLRVSQQFHTISQVIVGAAVGSIFSVLWFWLWHGIVLEAFISFWWVRTIVVLGATAFSQCFIVYVIRNWLTN